MKQFLFVAVLTLPIYKVTIPIIPVKDCTCEHNINKPLFDLKNELEKLIKIQNVEQELP